jgi:hypothetical protein
MKKDLPLNHLQIAASLLEHIKSSTSFSLKFLLPTLDNIDKPYVSIPSHFRCRGQAVGRNLAQTLHTLWTPWRERSHLSCTLHTSPWPISCSNFGRHTSGLDDVFNCNRCLTMSSLLICKNWRLACKKTLFQRSALSALGSLSTTSRATTQMMQRWKARLNSSWETWRAAGKPMHLTSIGSSNARLNEWCSIGLSPSSDTVIGCSSCQMDTQSWFRSTCVDLTYWDRKWGEEICSMSTVYD